MAGSLQVGSSGDPDLDGILSGLMWDTKQLTFSFPTSSDLFHVGYRLGEPDSAFEALNSIQKETVRSVYEMYTAVAGLTFTEMTETAASHAVLRFAMSDVPPTAHAYYPGWDAEAGDSWYRNTGGSYDSPRIGNWAYHTFIHEIGHSLGLKHAHEDDGYGAMTWAHDAMEYTVMTYRSYAGHPGDYYTNEMWGYAQTLMLYDIAALQHMYGANYATNAGNTLYRWSPSTGAFSVNGVSQGTPGANRVFMTVWDGGGKDTYNLSGYGTSVTIDLRPGEWSITSSIQLADLGDGRSAVGNVANAFLCNGDLRSIIENAICGGGNDVIIANVAANVLDGRGGRDTVVLSGERSDYVFTGTSAALSAATGGTTDLLKNVELVQFDGSGQVVSVADLVPSVIDDYRDSLSDASAPLGVFVSGIAQGSVENAADVDVFKIRLTAGVSYTFDLVGVSLSNPILALQNAAGKFVLRNDNFNGEDSRIVFTPGASGTFYLLADGVGTSVGDYTLRSRARYDDFRDHLGDTIGSLGRLAPGASLQGAIETGGDTDLVAIRLLAGQAYVFTLQGRHGGGGSLSNPMLELRNAAGEILRSNDNFDGSYDSRLEFRSSATATFYLTADAVGSARGTYTIRAGALDDFRDTLTDTTAPFGALRVGGSLKGNLESSGDTDVFKVVLSQGQNYTIDLVGFSGGGGTLPDPLLELRSGDGVLIASNDDFNGLSSRLVFTAAEGGSYYLTADSYDQGVGTYTIRARAGYDDARDAYNKSGPLPIVQIGGSKLGAIEAAGDLDVYAVRLTAGKTFVFDLRGSASFSGTLADPYLVLTDNAGVSLVQNDDFTSYDSHLVFTAAQTATYYLIASGFGTNTGTYELSVGVDADGGNDRGSFSWLRSFDALGDAAPRALHEHNAQDLLWTHHLF